MALPQLQSKKGVTEIMPVNDNLGRPHATNKPHNHESRDAGWVLPHSQLSLVCVNERP